MKGRKKAERAGVDHTGPLLPEPQPDDRWQEYIREKEIITYKVKCGCYSCQANRRYFNDIWLPRKLSEEKFLTGTRPHEKTTA